MGLAVAIKLTPVVFVLFFLLRKDLRAVAVTGLSALTWIVLGCVFAWQDSIRYWFTGAGPTTDVRGSSFATNQALAGALTRLGLGQPWELLGWAVVAGTVVWMCAGRSACRRADRAGALADLLVAPLGVDRAALTVLLTGPHHHAPNSGLDWEWWQHLYLLVARPPSCRSPGDLGRRRHQTPAEHQEKL